MKDFALSDTGAGDIKGGTVGDWLVAGWFTPDYRPLAEAFAGNLRAHGAPYHLWAKPALGKWNTQRKPSVVLEAMDAYPGKTIILMDVDCVVRADITPMLANIIGDIGITVTALDAPRGAVKARQHWLTFETSSRVVVFRPTAGARRFAEEWKVQIERSTLDHDEYSMAWAFLRCASVGFSYIDRIYSGREITAMPDGIVVHHSEHSKRRRDARGAVKNVLRAIERRFRTGRTRARKKLLQPPTQLASAAQ